MSFLDFLAAMADANGEDLSKLALWYGQAGTPLVKVKMEQDIDAKTLTLTCTQTTPPTFGQETKVPVMIPLLTGLIGKDDGKEVPYAVQGSSAAAATSQVLRLTEAEQVFVLEGVDKKVVLSTNR